MGNRGDDTMTSFTAVTNGFPDCNPAPDSLGVQVRIRPAIEGDSRAFYGRRLGGEPCFYRYGAPLVGVKAWAPLPAIDPGTVWRERDGRSCTRRVRVVVDGRDRAAVRYAPGYEAVAVPVGKIGIVTVKDGAASGRVTFANPDRFLGQAGGYVPD